ncbi:hypothetical protein BDV95DRAFT_574851 [Massariosphaeria phaeospora]|uniref:Uncharacterized protein n=1 Tax=Massariosphaeria phaeospora TaxID=100035 RepID=A0A7C8MJM1_9PLEO|nr:hypothetical protein BDV95DRAFT_574851 [Massariosphaeria phaeospora]
MQNTPTDPERMVDEAPIHPESMADEPPAPTPTHPETTAEEPPASPPTPTRPEKMADEQPPAPTYSTWEYDPTIQNIRPVQRAASPPAEIDPPSYNALARELTDREEHVQNAAQLRDKGLPYTLLAPWSTELLSFCVEHQDLLERYYAVEQLTWQTVVGRLSYIRSGEAFNEEKSDDARFEQELMMLSEVEDAIMGEERMFEDQAILVALLQRVQTRLDREVRRLQSGLLDDDDAGVEPITQLPEMLLGMVQRGEELNEVYRDLVAQEERWFPRRFLEDGEVEEGEVVEGDDKENGGGSS